MNIYTSYFYQVRFFETNMLPVSTAVWDPKWYHEFKEPDHIFVDKNGVMNGFRASYFAPDNTCRDKCRGPKNCSTHGDYNNCDFLKLYVEQLNRLDFNKVMDDLNKKARLVKTALCLNKSIDIVLLFHESTDNFCSERISVQKWFIKNGVTVNEWCK